MIDPASRWGGLPEADFSNQWANLRVIVGSTRREYVMGEDQLRELKLSVCERVHV